MELEGGGSVPTVHGREAGLDSRYIYMYIYSTERAARF